MSKIFNLFAPIYAKSYTNPTWDETKIPNLHDKIAIVTGANTGLGFCIALALASHGARVFVAARSESKGKAACEDIQSKTGNRRVEFLYLDLADIRYTKAAAENFIATGLKIDILINNAGLLDGIFTLTPRDKIESQLAVNYIGAFVFTTTLIPALQKGARIVNVNSNFHRSVDTIFFDNLNSGLELLTWSQRYGQSRLAGVLFTRSLQKLLGNEYYVNCCHPGQMGQSLSKNVTQYGILGYFYHLEKKFLNQAFEIGALTPLYLATSPEVVQLGIRGEYLTSVARRSMDLINPIAMDTQLATQLWAYTEELVQGKLESTH